MSRLRKTIWSIVVFLPAGTLVSAHVPNHYHQLPKSLSRYILALERPSLCAGQQTERVIPVRLGDRVLNLGASPRYLTLRISHAVGPAGMIYGAHISHMMFGYRLVNVDFHKWSRPVDPTVQLKTPKAEMIPDAEAAGFHLACRYNFLPCQYFVVFAR